MPAGPKPAERVLQRIAVPDDRRMISSTLLTLIVIPAVYGLVKGWRLPVLRAADGTVPEKSMDDLKAVE